MNYKKDRQKTKQKLISLYAFILRLMRARKWARQITERNRLVLHCQFHYPKHINFESVPRLQRKAICTYPELDTKENIKYRANRECAYKSTLKSK